MTSAGFDWSASVIWEGPGAIAGSEEHLSADRLERAQYAHFLTNYLAAEGKQRNYVLNLNAEWGAGKTWFIKRWYMELKAHYPTVYIDAWQQDFSDDPLLTVISSIIEQLKEEAGTPQLSPYLSTKLASLLKATAPIMTKALFRKVSGINIDEVQEVITADDAGKLVESLFQDTQKKTEAVQLLKHEIKQWVEAIIGKRKKQAPAFILIDELDRCRPSYAVEMLETIKHIFDISGVVFVLATDTEQLQHAIKVIYGEEFNAKAYLRRFFKRRFHLKSIPIDRFIKPVIENHLDLFKNKVIQNLSNIDDLVGVLSYVVEAFELPAREVELFLDRLIATITSMDSRRVDIIYFSVVLISHEFDSNAYQLIKNGGIVFSPSRMTPDEKRADKINWLSKNSQISILFYGFNPQLKGQLISYSCKGLSEYLANVHIALIENESVINDCVGMKEGRVLSERFVTGGGGYKCDDTYFRCAIYDCGRTLSDYTDLVEFSMLLE